MLLIETQRVAVSRVALCGEGYEVRNGTLRALTGFASLLIEGDQALLVPPGAHAKGIYARAAQLFAYGAGNRVVAWGGKGFPDTLRPCDEHLIAYL